MNPATFDGIGAELLPFELTQMNVLTMLFSCFLTMLITGSTFIFFWEKYVLSVRRQRECNWSIYVRERHMARQLKEAASWIQKLNMPKSRGLDHARMVFFHAVIALSKYSDRAGMNPIMMDNKFAVLLAALLHDVDDRKYFPGHNNFENARMIMKRVGIPSDMRKPIVRMIGYASYSKNRDSIPDEAKESPWILIPRHCNRLETIGWTGVVRAWKYYAETHGRLSMPATLRAITRKELWEIATPARYAYYSNIGRSNSMIDHYYDKLLHLHREPMNNTYLDREKMRRMEPLITLCLRFGNTGILPMKTLKLARWQSLIEAHNVRSQVRNIEPMSGAMRVTISSIMGM